MADDKTPSYYHRGGEPHLLGNTIGQHIAKVCQQHGQRQALVVIHQQIRLTYSELAREVEKLAKGLLALGFNRGERIGIWSTNNAQWLILQLATASIGVVLVNINPAYREQELAYALKRSQVQGLFLIPGFRSSDYVAMMRNIAKELDSQPANSLHSAALPDLRRVVIYDPANVMHSQAPASGFTPWQDVIDAGKEITAQQLAQAGAQLDRDDAINIQYTSGTTGFPKAVTLTHHNILNNAYFCAQAMHFTAEDRLCVPVPFYHCFGMVLANLLCLSVGACIVVPGEHFDADKVLQAVEQEHCTAIHGVPTMFIAALEHPDFWEFDLTSLRTGIMAGAPCPPALMTRVMEEMHCGEILIGYGQTEASPITHLTSRDDSLERRTLTVGRNLQHQEVKIVDTTTGATVPLGEVGELCFRGYHIMQGYYADEQATAKTIDGQHWLHSGDLGTMDEQGYVRITGRLKEMVIRGGENIYPREIEDFLFTHPAIAAAAVFGVPDDYYGEELMVWIKLHEGSRLSEQEVREFCKNKIAHFKIPRYIKFVDEFPLTVTGKIQKFRMRELALEEMDNK